MEYIKIVAYHIVRTATRVPQHYVTLCGRSANGTPVADFGDAATCESCLRISAKINKE